MRIYFIRHGLTKDNKERRISGHADVPLTEEGKDQIKEVAKGISSGPSRIYSGDLARHRQTSEILNRILQLPVTYDTRLREKHFGSLEGKVWSDVDPDGLLWDANLRQTYDYRPHGGESVEQVRERLFEWIHETQQKHTEESIIAVTSAGIIRLLYKLLRKEIPEIISNGSVHLFEFPDI